MPDYNDYKENIQVEMPNGSVISVKTTYAVPKECILFRHREVIGLSMAVEIWAVLGRIPFLW